MQLYGQFIRLHYCVPFHNFQLRVIYHTGIYLLIEDITNNNGPFVSIFNPYIGRQIVRYNGILRHICNSDWHQQLSIDRILQQIDKPKEGGKKYKKKKGKKLSLAFAAKRASHLNEKANLFN